LFEASVTASSLCTLNEVAASSARTPLDETASELLPKRETKSLERSIFAAEAATTSFAL
jgi:hypothetical protein